MPSVHGLVAGAWSGARGLSGRRRRLVRLAAVAAAAASGTAEVVADRQVRRERMARVADRPPVTDPDELVAEMRTAFRKSTERYRRQPVLSVTAVVASVSLAASRRRLEKRWLGDLTSAGHPHPHLVTGVRVGLLTFAGRLPSAVLDLRARHADDR